MVENLCPVLGRSITSTIGPLAAQAGCVRLDAHLVLFSPSDVQHVKTSIESVLTIVSIVSPSRAFAEAAHSRPSLDN